MWKLLICWCVTVFFLLFSFLTFCDSNCDFGRCLCFMLAGKETCNRFQEKVNLEGKQKFSCLSTPSGTVSFLLWSGFMMVMVIIFHVHKVKETMLYYRGLKWWICLLLCHCSGLNFISSEKTGVMNFNISKTEKAIAFKGISSWYFLFLNAHVTNELNCMFSPNWGVQFREMRSNLRKDLGRIPLADKLASDYDVYVDAPFFFFFVQRSMLKHARNLKVWECKLHELVEIKICQS